MHQQLLEAIKYWNHIVPIVRYPKNHTEYNKLVSQLDELLEMVGNNEKHLILQKAASINS
jgi:HTH-type transcriptional regulator/antitoxin HigA